MKRGTQDKAKRFASDANPNLPALPLALLSYPVLQAADILVYK
jgi:tryptophanyl-tRNA synthetase